MSISPVVPGVIIEPSTKTAELCPRVDFAAVPVKRNGVGYTGFVSRRRTLVRNSDTSGPLEPRVGVGDCGTICGRLVLNPGRGTMQVMIHSGHKLCVGGFLNKNGRPTGALRGELRGTVMIFTSTTHTPPAIAADGTSCDGPYGQPPWGINPDCEKTPDGGGFSQDCIYCVHEEDQARCSIEQTDPTHVPCAPYGVPGRNSIAPPGALIRPEAGSWDVLGYDGPFYANDGLTGKVRYYLKTVLLGVYPVWPSRQVVCEVGGSQPFCAWLCFATIHHNGPHAWELWCNSPIKNKQGNADQTQPRVMKLMPLFGPSVFVNFSFAHPDWTGPCFQLTDQMCLTGHPDHDWWEHLEEGEGRMTVLDSLGIDLNMKIAEDPDRYPHKEADVVAIQNDALSQLGDHVHGLTNVGHERLHWYDTHGINMWNHFQGFGDCASAPVVRKGGGGGEPWTVYVQPYGSKCRFPCDLILRSVAIHLFMSGDVGAAGICGGGNLGTIRIVANFECVLELGLRLRSGWESIDCDVGFASDDPCDVTLDDPDRVAVYTTDNGTYVPLRVEWRGLLGPQPYSRTEAEFVPMQGQDVCCSFIHAIHELVIPGEVNDTESPTGPQRFAGDVILFLGGGSVPGQNIC